MKNKGSAVLIALLVVALISVVGFGVARIAIVQIRIASINDSALRAYHAAEAGMEYALLQYKLNPDAMISEQVKSNPSIKIVAKAMGTKPAMNATPLCHDDSTLCRLSSSDQSFEVLMYNQTYFLGKESCFYAAVEGRLVNQCQDAESALGKLSYDETYTFKKEVNTEVYLRAEPENIPTATNNMNITKGAVVVTGIDENGQIIVKSVYNLANNTRDAITQGGGSSFQLVSTLGIGAGGASYNNARTVTIQYFAPTDGTDLGELNFALQTKNSSNSLVPFDNGITTIEVVGKSTGTERRLKGLIDRSTNKILGIFDNAIYAVDRVEVVE